MSTAITIVNLIGQNVTDIQQLLAAGDNILKGKSVSHVVIGASPREHSWLLNLANSPRRNVLHH
jgi:hypothetical protein